MYAAILRWIISNNDTMMQGLSELLFDQYEITYDPEHYRIRCNGHIINLAAQSFLFPTDSEALPVENNTYKN
ncbi:hypothetical protein LIPSTDRAFT_168952 [Lipomyces starkeyi NRRL Y-11557]|uniref:Uncharacterized protein n=1 Tax=Lipomyces starkeyi NRRL Y-11557 TaxID=675824 RepID=A0A1E3PYN1_LIPST|nr:hypothetical protein LIPSTDRAFT_168952 [Lipomyces starkeyi NRRL Y-11557]